MSAAALTRRTILAGMAVAPFARTAGAQAAWPSKPVRVIVPYPPGGGADTTARIVYQKLGELWGKQFVIDNRGGAGGTIAEAVAAKADPDGYTIMHDATAFSVNPALYTRLTFDYAKDFQPVALVSLVPNILVVTPSVEAKTVADIVELAKKPRRPRLRLVGQRHAAASLPGAPASTAKVQINHIPYRGGGDALKDVVAGHVKYFFSNGSASVGLVQGGKVKAIAHTGKGRLGTLPDLPAVQDTIAGFEGYEWNGLFVPPELRRRSSEAQRRRQRGAAPPDVSTRFKQLNIEYRHTTPEEFRSFVGDQMARWGKVVKDANIKLG